MIRVLHVVGAMYPGGLENFIMNLYEDIDRTKFQFDFVVHARKEGDYGELIEAMGGRIFLLPRLTTHPFKNLRMLFRLVKDNRYRIVIRHTANALVSPQLLVAKLAGAKTICHSHNETDPSRVLHCLGRLLLPVATDDYIACSPKAGAWMYGKRPFTVIKNAIHLDKFAYSKAKADKVDEEFSIKGKHVYGHIANFIASKNHMFLIDVFKEILLLDNDAVFFCLGEGELRQSIEEKIRENNLENQVILTGIRKDVENFMSRMDVLVFPSFFEGLPLTLIEAQASSLPMIISDTITKDVVVTEGLVNWGNINASPKEWAQVAVRLMHQDFDRTKCQEKSISQAGYNMKELVSYYENYYESLVCNGEDGCD